MSEILKLVQDLSSEDESVRSYAVLDLGKLNNERAVQPLVQLLLKEKSVIIRESIFSAIGQIDASSALDALIDLLKSNDVFIRNQAISILKEKGTIVFEPLRNLLNDPDKDIRKIALDALFNFRHPEAADIIVEGLSDLSINVKITAVEYLGKLEAKKHSWEINRILKESNNLLLTCACLESLALIGNEESLNIIRNEYSDLNKIDPMLLFSLVKVIGSIGDEDSLNLLTEILDKFGDLISKEMIQSVKKISKRKKINYLPDKLYYAFIQTMNELNEMGTYSVLNLLSSFKNESIYLLLVEKLASKNRMIKIAAIEGLGKYGNSEALPILEKMIESEEDEELLEVLNDTVESLK